MKSKIPDRREIDIYGLSYGGEGIGKIDEKVCFVEGALPGERVCASIQENKKRYSRGVTLSVITASADRVTPPCPYYGVCGGCQYQHLSYEKEIAYKLEQALELMHRIGKLDDFRLDGITASEHFYGYRKSITLHKPSDSYGYFAKDNKTIVSIDRCMLASQAINIRILEFIKTGAKKNLTIKSDNAGTCYASNHHNNRFYTDIFCGQDIIFSTLAFSQANTEIALSMVEWLRESVKEQKGGCLFDVFCGIGFFGILLRDLFDRVIGIDNSSIAIDCAKQTKSRFSSQDIKFYCADAFKKFYEYFERFSLMSDTIIIDPPRHGLTREFSELISNIKGVNRIYYISCNPATLARDSSVIVRNNRWRFASLKCFDMFPRTKHIEAIAVFEKNN